MNTRRTSQIRKSERGSGLLMALCLASVFTVCLASYISLSYTSLYISNRNLANGHAVELAEAGMEQALWSINNSSWTGWTLSGSTQTLATTGFNYSANTTGEFDLTVTNYASTAPTITAVGKVTLSDGTVITHTTSSSCGPVPTFVNAMGGVNGRVKFKHGGTVDSYNSALGSYASQTAGGSAIILSSSSSTSSATVSLGTASVKGYVVTQTGSYAPSTSSATISSSNILTEQNPDLPVFNESSVNLSGATTLTMSGNTTIGSPTATAAQVYYLNSDLNLSSTTLYINGPVVLYVTGNVNISGTGGIVVNATTNASGAYVASLELHLQGALTMGGNGISNLTQSPLHLALIDTQDQNYWSPTASSQADTISTTTAFYGVLYFPYDSMTISSNITIYGALTANSISLSGTLPVFHYDTNLRTPSTLITSAAFTAISTPTAITSYNQTN